MEKKTPLTDSEKIELIGRRIKRMEFSQHIQTAITILVFLGVVNFAMLATKAKKII